MKNHLSVLFILLFLSLVTNTALGQLNTDDLKKPAVKRELLKEYFLCVCITEGFRNLQIDEFDISQAVYFDITGYAPEAFQEVKEYAKKFVDTIEPSIIEDLGHKKAIILQCIEKYKSKEVDKFIKSLDKYMNK